MSRAAEAEFHARYANLAFPGGEQGEVLQRILRGDLEAMKAAICFLEVRPFFFRSGYMFKDILRKCRRAPLSPDQATRLRVIEKKAARMARAQSGKEEADIDTHFTESGVESPDGVEANNRYRLELSQNLLSVQRE